MTWGKAFGPWLEENPYALHRTKQPIPASINLTFYIWVPERALGLSITIREAVSARIIT
jgi:hypothetical protein